MIFFITIAYLFAMGCTIGWVLELFYRKFFDPVNVERKWLNPGFLTGPYLPLYGFAMWLLFAMSRTERFIHIDNYYLRKFTLFIVMALAITLLEYVTGMIFIVKMKIMLWDYRQFPGNIKGIICPMYTFFWFVLSLFYCLFIDPAITDSVHFLMHHMPLSFFVGLYFGVFFVDLFISINNLVNIAEFARKHNIIVSIDELRAAINSFRERSREQPLFFLPIHLPVNLSDTLSANLERYREFREKHSLKKLRSSIWKK